VGDPWYFPSSPGKKPGRAFNNVRSARLFSVQSPEDTRDWTFLEREKRLYELPRSRFRDTPLRGKEQRTLFGKQGLAYRCPEERSKEETLAYVLPSPVHGHLPTSILGHRVIRVHVTASSCIP